MSQNLLRHETSPYLLQHQDNPVHWRPWGPEALEEAAQSGKPILLSVGYAACHWCHVMAHESFEDEATAALMNEHFINIKVDREERPDVDSLYMAALQMLGEQGGWPLTMFLTPEGEPFWGGTYFPPEPRWGRPSFQAVLREIARLHTEDRATVDNNRKVLRTRLEAMARQEPGESLSLQDVDRAADQLLSMIDLVHGGIRGAPKFPNTAVFDVVLRAGIRRGEQNHVDAVLFTLEKICQGGIYDHLGGGFARYSVDARWLVPHFEKMLYDNAQLVAILTTAAQVSGRPLFRTRIEETVAWLEREMMVEDAAFASSLDADSEGEEGRYYVWTEDDVRAVLPPDDFAAFAVVYDITRDGNWEGRTILNRLGPAGAFDMAREPLLAPLRRALLEARSTRVRPDRDDKVLADWNGLAIGALSRAAMVLDRPDWLERARNAFAFIVEHLDQGGRLHHSWRSGRPGANGLASDHANMASAACSLYEATGDNAYLAHADRWIDALVDRFAAESGGFHMSAETATDLIVRPVAVADDATPSASAVAADTMLRLECFTGNTRHRSTVDGTFRALSETARSQPQAQGTLLAAAERAGAASTIVIAGAPSETTGRFMRAAWSAARPTAAIMRVADTAGLSPDHPAYGKPVEPSAAYVCEQQVCSPPITDPDALLERLQAGS